ncbi:MAG: sulfatase-like hydrolase/transferase, partial [Verrucomicrobiota bacterium]
PEKYLDPYIGEFEGKKMPTHFYGMIANLDENLGRLEAFLDEKGLKDNTIVIYLADNGTQSTLAKEIYNAGMREKKTSVYEGGHRVPLFIRWPNGKFQHGKDIAEMVQVQDLLPTLIELCELKSIESPLPFDGTSLAGLLTGEVTDLPDRKLVVQYRSSGAPWDPAVVMWNEWRLLRSKKGRNPQPPNASFELYNIANDPGQQNNVIEQSPEVAEAMKAHYDSWYEKAKPLFDRPRWITIGSESANAVILYSQDWVGDYCDNPGGLRRATAQGYWNVIVDRGGTYEIGLRRWPKESGKTLTEGWNGPQAKDSTARPITAGNLQIGDANYTLDTATEAQEVRFLIRLDAGKTQLRTHFLDAEDRALSGAFYTYVERLEATDKELTPMSERRATGNAPAPVTAKRKGGNAGGSEAAIPIKLKPGDLLIADFEGGDYSDWEAEGKAFGSGPTKELRVAMNEGKQLVDSFIIGGGDQATGKLTSPGFKIERDRINFMIGGGNHRDQTCVNLVVDEKKIRTATGSATKDGSGKKVMHWVSWNVAKFKGQEARIEILDLASGGWGHIVVDQIFQSNQPTK